MLLEKDHQGLDLCRDATNVQFVIKKKKNTGEEQQNKECLYSCQIIMLHTWNF